MKSPTVKIALSALVLSCVISSDAEAQIFRKVPSGFRQRSQAPSQRFFGNPNRNRIGGLPLQDRYGNRSTSNHRIRDNRILSDGSMQWVPNRDPSLNQVIQP